MNQITELPVWHTYRKFFLYNMQYMKYNNIVKKIKSIIWNVVKVKEMSKKNSKNVLRKKNKDLEVKGAVREEIVNLIMMVFMVAFFVGLPLFYQDHYYEMSLWKWKFSMWIMIPAISLVVILSVKQIWQQRKKWLITDFFVLAYILITGISTIFAVNRKTALFGTMGWYMGLFAQLLMVAAYFAFSYAKVSLPFLIGANCVGSGITCFLAIFQRFNVDILHLYWEMPAEVKRDYVSTVGNRTWYSGYLCVSLPMGMYFAWRSEKLWQKICLGLYVALGFGGLVMTYSDSAYVGIIGIFVILAIMSTGSLKKCFSFMLIVSECFGSVTLLGILYRIILKADFEMRASRGISSILLECKWMFIPFLVVAIGTVVLGIILKKKGNLEMSSANRKMLGAFFALTILSVGVLVVLFVVYNSIGGVEKLFGHTFFNKYLYFDDAWGDQRGYNWKLTFRMWKELPVYRQLIGIGADNFMAYAYSKPEYAGSLFANYPGQLLQNAHNEWLNILLCQGALGMISYVGIFISFLYCAFMKPLAESNHKGIKWSPLTVAVGLCIVGYLVHNFFCYQQIMAVFPAFVLMGLARNTFRCQNEDKTN